MPPIVSDTPIDSIGAVPPPPAPPVRSTSHDPTVPGYRITGLLGRGGMGVVYSAVDETLGRAVALKILPAGWTADSELAERLRAEAAALARMQHPNIVQIFEVGEMLGRPYLSLELITGGSLAERLRQGPMEPAPSAAMVAELATAVAHAHGLGIVHRDLKPGNVLLSVTGGKPTSETSLNAERSLPTTIPKITDFGLAKTVESGHTRTGAVLGTPSYMAPEQAGGGRDVGPPADIYALGAVLYECLTGRPPFRAASDLETLDLVRSAEPVSIRRLQPTVPRDLETVCLKCLAKSPTQRYESAQSLADDLASYLAGRPVRARRAGPIERVVKWAQRRPTAAALIALVVAGIAAGLGGVAVHTSRLKAALALVNREKTRADEDYRASRSAMKGMLGLFNDPRYVDVPRVIELRNNQYEQALNYYASVIARQDDPDLAVRLDVAQAYLDSAGLRTSLGRPALPEIRQAIARYRAVVADAPDHREGRLQLGASLDELAYVLMDDESTRAEATAAAAEAAAIHTELFRLDPSSITYADALASSHNRVGSVYFHGLDYPNAERAYAAAADLWAPRITDEPRDRGRLRSLAEVQINLSIVVQQMNRNDEALRRRSEAMASLEKLLKLDPRDRKSASSLAILRVNWAYRQESNEALVDMDKNLALLTPMLASEPDDVTLRRAMYCTLGMKAVKFEALKRPLETAQAIERAIEFAANPADKLQIRIDTAGCWMRAGDPARGLKFADELVAAVKPTEVQWLAMQLPQVYANAVAATEQAELRRQRLAHGRRQVGLILTMAHRDQPVEEWKKIRTHLLGDAELRELLDNKELRTLLRE